MQKFCLVTDSWVIVWHSIILLWFMYKIKKKNNWTKQCWCSRKKKKKKGSTPKNRVHKYIRFLLIDINHCCLAQTCWCLLFCLWRLCRQLMDQLEEWNQLEFLLHHHYHWYNKRDTFGSYWSPFSIKSVRSAMVTYQAFIINSW